MIDSPHPSDLADYPVVVTAHVQWGDQDIFGHVNNTVHIRWFESARMAYSVRCGMDGRLGGTFDPILVSISCNYRKQVSFPDTVRIGARVSRIGRTSMTMDHAVYSELQECLVADGDSIIVVFDYEAQKPSRIPNEMRATVNELQGTDY